MNKKTIDVLDKGFVKLIDHMGSDLSVSNAARVSFNKYKEVLDSKDEALIKYLANHKHWTPFAHTHVTLHIKAPLYIRTQLFKHKVGGVENEISRRYVDFQPDFYTPKVFRGKPEGSIKQGSKKEAIEQADLAKSLYVKSNQDALVVYNTLIKLGVAPEIARGALPTASYTEWYWSGSVAFFARVVALRAAKDAQEECQGYAFAIDDIMSDLYPISWRALTKNV